MAYSGLAFIENTFAYFASASRLLRLKKFLRSYHPFEGLKHKK
jgi:hypothetical protein